MPWKERLNLIIKMIRMDMDRVPIKRISWKEGLNLVIKMIRMDADTTQGPLFTLKKSLPGASGLGNQTRMDDIQQTNETIH